MDDIIFATLNPRAPAFTEQAWVDWIKQNNTNQEREERMKRIAKRDYPFERVDLLPSDHEKVKSLTANFPGFLEYCFTLPVKFWKLSFISQISGRDCHWHHDFDGSGVGIRICLAGKDDGTLELLPTTNMSENDDLGNSPYLNEPYGAISKKALPFVKQPPTVIVPKGVHTGKTWMISSRLALHRVKATQNLRVQCILAGEPDKIKLARMLEPNSIVRAS